MLRSLIGLPPLKEHGPEEILEQEKEKLREHINRFNQGLASQAALIEPLTREIKTLEQAEQTALAQATASIEANEKDVAANEALRLKTIREHLALHRTHHQEAQHAINDLTLARDHAIAEARHKIEQIERAIASVKINQATADLNELTTEIAALSQQEKSSMAQLNKLLIEEDAKASARTEVTQLDRTILDAQAYIPEEDTRKELALKELTQELGQRGNG